MRSSAPLALALLVSVPLVSLLVGRSSEAQELPLEGDRLVVRDLNFSIRAPGPGWLFQRVSRSTYSCTKDGRMFLVTADGTRRVEAVDEVAAKLFLRDFLESQSKQGVIRGENAQVAPAPELDGLACFRFAFDFPVEGRPPGHAFGYIAAARIHYSFVHMFVGDPVEPETFKTFVSSFRLVEPRLASTAKPLPTDVVVRLVAGIGLAVLVFGVVVAKVLAAKRSKPAS